MADSVTSSKSAAVSSAAAQPSAKPRLNPKPRNPVGFKCIPKGLFRIIGFFLLAGLLAISLHLLINHGLRSIKVSKFGSLNRVVDGKVNAEILINGSSRALCHYDPRIIEKVTGMTAYNIGMNASQIDLELAILKTYLRHNTKPKVLIQNLDLFSFETTEKGAVYDPGYFLPYLSENDLYQFLRGIDPGVWKWKHLPLYGYAVEDMRFTWVWGLLGNVNIQGSEDYFLGFNPRYGDWNADFANFKSHLNAGVHYKIEPAGVTCLEEIIRLCQQSGIKVIMVYSPEYSEMQALELNRAEIIGRFQNLADQFKIPFLDYSDSTISRQRELFNNSQHLNASGAEAFSRDFADHLVSVLK